MKSERDVVSAFLAFEEAAFGRLQAEVRPGRRTTDPRTGQTVDGLPIALLWSEDQPVAALVGPVVLTNQGAREKSLRTFVSEEARRCGREVQLVREPDLWRLASGPPPGWPQRARNALD